MFIDQNDFKVGFDDTLNDFDHAKKVLRYCDSIFELCLSFY